MNKSEENKYSMFLAVKQVLSDNREKLGAVPVLPKLTDEFFDRLEQISRADADYMTAAKGTGESKDQAEEDLIKKTLPLSGALYVYGRREGNQNIVSTMRYKESLLKNMRDTELLQTAKTVLKTLDEHTGGLRDYGIGSNQIADYRQVVTGYENAITSGEARSSLSISSRSELTELFIKTGELLKEEIDFLMESFKEQDKSLYSLYKNARVIKDL